MQSADFASNPFGVDFVPEEIEQRLAAGESVKSVLQRPPSGPRTYTALSSDVTVLVNNSLGGPESVPLLAH